MSNKGSALNNEASNLAIRLKQLESLTGGLVRREPAVEVTPERDDPVSLVPVPRRSRVFLRHGEGHGEFADVTLTAPVVRTYLT